MSPRKQPDSLFKFCVRSCLGLINSACYIIEKSYPESEFHEYKHMTYSLKNYVMSMLPARLFDVLCSERDSCQYRADPRIQLFVLSHPHITVFRKCHLDTGISQDFWIETLASFNKLRVLDLKFLCTDEILHVISVNCPLLEEINIMSRVDVCKSPFNASVLIRNVSDAGLRSIAKLKNLRILAMDSPRNERANKIGRCVSQTGIIMLVSLLPYLEELNIESCDVGATLIGSDMKFGPLSLRKVICHFSSPERIKKLIKLCPFLKEFAVTHLSDLDKDAVLDQIALSELRLNNLELSFFSYTYSMQQLLTVKGSYLTHFLLFELENSLTLDSITTIGMCCPNLQSLTLLTQSKRLVFPRYFKQKKRIFTELKTLTLGNGFFDLNGMLAVLLDNNQNLQKLVLKYQTKINLDDTVLKLLERGNLKNINFIWIDCTMMVSKSVVQQLIQRCENLKTITVVFQEDMSDVQHYIRENNLDLNLKGSY